MADVVGSVLPCDYAGGAIRLAPVTRLTNAFGFVAWRRRSALQGRLPTQESKPFASDAEQALFAAAVPSLAPRSPVSRCSCRCGRISSGCRRARLRPCECVTRLRPRVVWLWPHPLPAYGSPCVNAGGVRHTGTCRWQRSACYSFSPQPASRPLISGRSPVRWLSTWLPPRYAQGSRAAPRCAARFFCAGAA